MDTRDYERDESWDSEEEKRNLLNRKTKLRGRFRIITVWLFSRLRIPRLLQLKRRRCYSPRLTCPRPSRRALKLCFLIFVLPLSFILFILSTPFLGNSYARLPQNYQDLAKRCFPAHPVPGCANPLKENIFIAATIRDPTGDLVSGKWGQNVLSLITILGQENAFVSIYENNSGPKGRAALEAFKGKIHSRHRVVIEGDEDKETPFDAGNVTLPDGSQRIKYYAYQAELRNRVLRPLDTFNKRLGGLGGQIDIIFDKVLFLDDIAFNPIDAAHLLFNTNLQPSPEKKDDPKKSKADYLLACALSYSSPLQLSPPSASALRDTQGNAPTHLFFPFFSSSSPTSLSATHTSLSQFSEAIPLKSCWSGMVAVRATYIQNLSPETDTYQAVQNHLLDPTSPLRPPPKDDEPRSPVRFRYEPSEYYDASTGCLFAADLSHWASIVSSSATPKTEGDGVNSKIFINPYVRVASANANANSNPEKVLSWLPLIREYERLLRPIFALLEGPWVRSNNPYREIQAGKTFEEEIWDVGSRKWTVADKPARLGRPGMFCGWRGMRVLSSHTQTGEGGARRRTTWTDLKVPPGYHIASGTGGGQLAEKEKLGGAWKDDYERLVGDIDAGRRSEEERGRFWEVE